MVRLIILLAILAILLTFALSGFWRVGRWFRRLKHWLEVRYNWLRGWPEEDEEDDDDDDDRIDENNTVTYVYKKKE